MAKHLEYQFKCDLCGHGEANTIGSDPKGWAKLMIENRHVDRDFEDKHVCRECAESIARQVTTA